MLGDEDKTARAKAANVIQKTRYAEEGNQDGERDPVPEFHQPRCKFAATSYKYYVTRKAAHTSQ